MASWVDSVPPSEVDLDLIPFFGADPSWTPAKEEKLADAPDKAVGQCLLCGGDSGFPLLGSDGLPVFDHDGCPIVAFEVLPGSHRICLRCMRSGDDQHSLGAQYEQPSVRTVVDSGYVYRDGVSVPEQYAQYLNED